MPGTHVPARAGVVLTALLMAAAVCNLTTGGASVALPDIAGTFDAPQTTLNLVALGTGLGLAMTVLYAGALGDRYGRVRLLCIGLIGLLIAGTAACLAPTIEFLMGARVLTGIAAGSPNLLLYTSTLDPSTPVVTVPTITGYSASSGAIGATITITGTNFTGVTAVRFNGVKATTFNVTNSDTVTATVPAGATTGPITITATDGVATGGSFTVQVPPSVPQSLKATNISRNGATLTWAAPSTGGPNLRYKVRLTTSATWTTTTNLSVTFASLSRNTSYTWQVVAVTDYGTSATAQSTFRTTR